MKKGLTLTVVLLIIAAVVAVVGFVQKADVEKKLTAAQELQKTAEAAKTAAEAQVGELETAKAAAEAQVGELETAKAALEAQVGELETAKAALEAQVGELEAAKAELEAKVNEATPAEAEPEEAAAPAETEPEEAVAVAQDKYGLGMVTSIGSVADATAEKAGAAQVNTTVCSLVLDAEGKIKSVTWDVQQTKIQFSAEGKPVDLPEQLLTKLEKGEAYGMRKASAIGKEWFEQIAAFAEYAVGKTVEEMLAMPVYERDASHTKVPDVEDLKASVTVTVGDYLAALEKAASNAKAGLEAPAAEDKYGLGMVTSIGSVADATAEKAGAAQVNTTVCSLVLDAEGKIKSVTWDVQQTKIQFSAEGKPVDLPEQLLTKLEKGEAYGMRKASAIGKEWFEQIAAFAEYAVGKTVEEMLAMPVYERDASHTKVPDVEDLKASVTVTVGDYLAALEKAANSAK